MKKCRQGYYYCYTDKKCKRIPLGYRVASSGYLRKENGEDSGENGENGENTNGNGNGGNGNGGGVSESKSGDSSLRDWFGKSRSSDGKPGWVQLGGKYAGKPCAKQPGQTTKPKCGSSKMAANLDDKEEKKAFNRKQRQDPNPDRKGKAINVKTEETVVEKAGEKDACYKKVKSRYSVWPSAYASGALVKCRKVGAANWGNKSESVEYSDWRNDFQATEYEFVDIIKPEPIKGGQEQIDENVSSGKSRLAKMGRVKGKPTGSITNAEKSAEVQKQKDTAKAKDREFASKVDVSGLSPSDALMKRRRAEFKAEKARLKSQKNMRREETESLGEGQKCWKGYEKKGTKKMFGKVVNNCVKKEGYDVGDVDQKVGAVTLIPKDEREAAKQRLLAKAKAKREKMKEEKEESKVGGGNLKKLAAKAVKRVDADVDGDVDTDDMKSSETGEFVPSPDGKKKLKPKVRFEQSDWRNELDEAIDKSKMKCNSPKSQAVGDSQTGKSHVVKACEGGKEKIIRFGQRGVKGSPKKEGESKEYASRRNRFKTRHAKNISKGKMSAAYWSNKVKW